MCGAIQIGSAKCWECLNGQCSGTKPKPPPAQKNMCTCNGEISYVYGACPRCDKPSGSTSCFAKDVGTACRLVDSSASAIAAFEACYHQDAQPLSAAVLVLMAELQAGDRVLSTTPKGELTTTTVVAIQHQSVDTFAEMLTFHMADGASVSMTPDHALFVDSMLVAAADVQVGSNLTGGDGHAAVVVERITRGAGAIVNPVTASGTLLASDGHGTPILAASHPIWIAPFVLHSLFARTLVNAAVGYVGDVDTFVGALGLDLGKLAASLGVVALALKMPKAASK